MAEENYLVTKVYKSTQLFPKEEMYGITTQIRRAAVSVPSNVSEGFGRKTTADFVHFLHISRGSLYELQTQIEISLLLGFMSKECSGELLSHCTEIEKMLNSLITSLNKSTKWTD